MRHDDAAGRLADIQDRIARATRLARRAVTDVTLIAVSKMHDADAIRPLIAAGHRVFGENRVQEAAAKWPALRDETPGIALHLVGQLQSNKAARGGCAVRRDPFARSFVAGDRAGQGDRRERTATRPVRPGQHRR